MAYCTRTVLALFAILLPVAVIAQDNMQVIRSGETIVGKNHLTGQDIASETFVFSRRIHTIRPSTHMSGQFYIHLRDFTPNGKSFESKGNLLFHDFSGEKPQWAFKIKKNMHRITYCSEGILISGSKLRFLDQTTGKERWKMNMFLFDAVPDKQIGLGYRGSTDILEGIDLNTGQQLWKRPINNEYGWNGIVSFTDSSMIVTAGGIHTVNYRTGGGWKCETPTGYKDYTGTVIGNVVGIASLLLSGSGFITTGYSLLGGVCSKPIADSTSVYMAARDEVFCVSHNGWKKWFVTLPKKHSSSSTAFLSDRLLWVVNYGMAGRGVKAGIPFVAAFQKESGQQEVFDIFENEIILDAQVRDSLLVVLWPGKIAWYDLETGLRLRRKELKLIGEEECLEFAGQGLFARNGSVFLDIMAKDDSLYFLKINSGILIADISGNIAGQKFNDDIYVMLHDTGTYRVIYNNQTAFVIDSRGKIAAEFTLDISESILSGDRLYIPAGKHLHIVDINDIVPALSTLTLMRLR